MGLKSHSLNIEYVIVVILLKSDQNGIEMNNIIASAPAIRD